MTTEPPFPADPAALEALQRRLAAESPPPWAPTPEGEVRVGAVFVCFPRGEAGVGARGDPGWAGAAVTAGREVVASVVVRGEAGAPYAPGRLAAREGPLLAAAVEALPVRPDVLLVNATGRDHPRRAGLALHLGWALDLPTVGVTHRPLDAAGPWPADARGALAVLLLDGETVGAWLRVERGVRPLAVHPGWRTDLDAAISAVLLATAPDRARTPRALRAARQRAREARALDQGRAIGPAGPLLAGG